MNLEVLIDLECVSTYPCRGDVFLGFGLYMTKCKERGLKKPLYVLYPKSVSPRHLHPHLPTCLPYKHPRKLQVAKERSPCLPGAKWACACSDPDEAVMKVGARG